MLNVMEKGMILNILKHSVKQLEAKVDIHRILSLDCLQGWNDPPNLEQAAIKVFDSVEFISAKC